jgi:hypothetical protein
MRVGSIVPSIPKSPLRPQGRVLALRTSGVLVAVCAAIGAVSAVSAVRDAPTAHHGPAFEVGIAHPAPTSFGTVAVEYAQFLGGPTLSALTGANHNIGSLVSPDNMQIEATVTITNASKRVIRYSPSQFDLLIDGSKKPLIATRASVGDGTLQPDAAIDVRLTFERKLSRRDATLRYIEHEGGRAVLMRLGHGDVTPQRAHGETPGRVTGIGQRVHAKHNHPGPTSSTAPHKHGDKP